MTKVLTDSRSIRLKGRSFMAVVLSPDMPIDSWLQRLDSLASRSAGFFLGRPVVLDVSEIEIDRPQLKTLIAELSARNVSVMGIEGGRPSLVEPGMPPHLKGGRPAADYDVPQTDEEASPVAETVTPVVVTEQRQAAPSLIVRETVRSGQSIVYTQGDVTVMGSVSSGAEVVAGGSVHIYGALRGRALAGCVGNAEARIFCRKFEAELIAIDGVYAVTEDLDQSLRGKPVQVRLENDAIVAEKMM